MRKLDLSRLQKYGLGSGAVGRLFVEIKRAFSVRMENDAFSVRGPDRKLIHTGVKCEPRGAGFVEEPDIAIALHQAIDGNAPAVGRKFRVLKSVCIGRSEIAQGLTGPIQPHELPFPNSAGAVTHHSRGGHREGSDTVTAIVCHVVSYHYGITANKALRCIETLGHQRSLTNK